MFQKTSSQGWQGNNGWKQHKIHTDLNCFEVENVSIIMGKADEQMVFPILVCTTLQEKGELLVKAATLPASALWGRWVCMGPFPGPSWSSHRNSSTGLFIVMDP